MEYGRILSSTFLHAGIEHLFNNMVILFFLGAMIEKVTGHLQFLILYLLSGIGANICSLIYKVIAMERIASVGAGVDYRTLPGELVSVLLRGHLSADSGLLRHAAKVMWGIELTIGKN